MPYLFTIPNWMPMSVNRLLGAHPYSRSKIKKADYEMITGYFLVSEIPKAKVKRSVRVHFTLGKGVRKKDPDNYNKILLDGLVKCGALVDDSDKWCVVLPPTFSRSQQNSVTITLEDVDE